jgi:aminoglycoside phosphotransferase (APT) family kinase protein
VGSTLKSDGGDAESDGWLQAHHAQWTTPPEVLASVLRRIGFEAARSERLIIGQANEVHAVETTSGEALIVRLAHRPDPKFFTEAAAIAAAHKVGVPVPEVLACERLGGGDGPTAVIVERRLPGVLLRDALARPGPAGRRLVEQLGELLAVVHTIPVEGFGNLSPELRGTHPTYPSWFVGLFVEAHLPEALEAVAGDAEATRLVRAAAAQIESANDVLAEVRPQLAFGDLSPTNVLVDKDRITGIVDWEAVKGGPPANDFAWWTTVHEDGDATFDALLAGYRRAVEIDIDDGFWPVLRLAKLRILVGLVGYASRVGDARTLRRAGDRLRNELGSA